MFQKKRLRNENEDGIQFMNYQKYKELVEKKFAAVLANDDLYLVIEEKDIIEKIKVPEFLVKVAFETGEPVENIVNHAIKYLILDMEYGKVNTNRSVLACVKAFPMEDKIKAELLSFILNNVGELK